MIKPILKLILTLTLYETAKYITEQLIVHVTQNDDVEVPADFDIHDHIHLNDLKAEVSD
ncbi:transcriptional activator RinB [Staphylococcus sp. HMSC056G08]|uniref:transcriptional activator RinB n=1 Tax=Staphylococcus sp. HMSC056G08 TaxID=1739350 RepID=UPI0008A65A5A|nr:transcriptional regulator [Staphylococcus sp. HMSC056G08]OFJ75086.1 transcriptional regulator [Staphylococcus sp. HMSC056G08]